LSVVFAATTAAAAASDQQGRGLHYTACCPATATAARTVGRITATARSKCLYLN
jgi:hypothetical protein